MNRHKVLLDFENDSILFGVDRTRLRKRSVSPQGNIGPTPRLNSDSGSKSISLRFPLKILPRLKPDGGEQEFITKAIGAAAYYLLAKNAKQNHTEIFAISVQDIDLLMAQNRTQQADAVDLNNVELADVFYQEFMDKLPFWLSDKTEIFDKSKAERLPPYRFYDYKIEFTGQEEPSKSRPYRMSPYKTEKVKKYLQKNLQKGYIVSSKAPYSSSILFALKANGDLRFCIDYRKLNAITKRNRYLLPLIDKIIDKIIGCKHLTRLNVIAAFNKLRMHFDSEDYTTFIITLGAYKYKMLPFGLTNGPASFQQYINDILWDHLNVFCQAYLDDILIYNKIKGEH